MVPLAQEVSCQGEFGKDDQLSSFSLAFMDLFNYFFQIGLEV